MNVNFPVPTPCPNCDAEWTKTEILSAALMGGGYRLICNECGHKWDDNKTSYEFRRLAWAAELS